MKKLIVQIPSYNEQETIASVIKSIPRKIDGFDKVEVLVFDDGSTDKTVELARRSGADYVYYNIKNQGLAKTFADALEKALSHKPDLIVNTDADGQYDQKQIVELIKPIINGHADMVIGNRQVNQLKWMRPVKRYGNIIGSFVLRFLTDTNITDASSGFRAMTAKCASSFILLSTHTYTHETIVQAINSGFVINEVPITFLERASGSSRLIGNVFGHISKSMTTIIRSILMYKAFKVLSIIGGLLLLTAFILGLRFVLLFITIGGEGHIQSLILAAILSIIG